MLKMVLCRTPQGVRGLKCLGAAAVLVEEKSHPARGAWIEIRRDGHVQRRGHIAPRKGCVD